MICKNIGIKDPILLKRLHDLFYSLSQNSYIKTEEWHYNTFYGNMNEQEIYERVYKK